MAIKHAFTSEKSDGGDATLVRPSNWNADHTGRIGKTQLEWTVNKLLKGAGIGADPTEIDVPAGPTVVRKTADEIVNNSTTLQNDDHLFITLGANEVWLLQLFLLLISPTTTPHHKFGFAYPSGCTMSWGDIRGSTTAGTYGRWITAGEQTIDGLLLETGLAYATPYAGATTYGLLIDCIVKNGSTAGTLNLQWAQVTATAEDTKVLANSCLVAHKLG